MAFSSDTIDTCRRCFLTLVQRKRRKGRHAKTHSNGHLGRRDEGLFSNLGNGARFLGGRRSAVPARPARQIGVGEQLAVHQVHPDVPHASPGGNDGESLSHSPQGSPLGAEAVSSDEISRQELVRENPQVPKWLPELPAHQEIILPISVATAPAPPPRESSARTKPTLQMVKNLAESESPLPPPPPALFNRQSTWSSTYADSTMSSAPSSRPSTIVYPSPLRPRPVTRNPPR